MSELPKGWVEERLCELCEFNPKHPADTDRTAHVSFVPMPAVDDKTGTLSAELERRSLSDVWKGYTHFAEGDVIFAKITPCMENGKIAVAEGLVNTMACGSTEFHVLRGKGCIESRYLWRYLRQSAVRRDAEKSMTGAVGQRRVPKAYLEEMRLPLPPLAEQKRIVARLNALSARSARARKELERIDALVTCYKQAVLSKAFSGELTKDWREKNPVRDIASDLSQVRTVRAQSKKLARRKRVAVHPSYDLPRGWHWISPDEIASDEPYSIGIGPFGSNLVKSDYRTAGVRLVFVRDIRAEYFGQDAAVFVEPEKATELHQHTVFGGDLLVTKMGDPPGDTAIYPPGQGAAVITADCIKLRAHSQLSSSPFLYWAIRADLVKEQIATVTKGVAHQKVSLDRFRQLALPVAPFAEQQEIVRRIESAFEKIDRLAGEAKRALALTDRLDAAVLAKAFRGELVPQDPNDEPASVLLERIKADRAAAPKPKRRRKAKRNGVPGEMST